MSTRFLKSRLPWKRKHGTVKERISQCPNMPYVLPERHPCGLVSSRALSTGYRFACPSSVSCYPVVGTHSPGLRGLCCVRGRPHGRLPPSLTCGGTAPAIRLPGVISRGVGGPAVDVPTTDTPRTPSPRPHPLFLGWGVQKNRFWGCWGPLGGVSD